MRYSGLVIAIVALCLAACGEKKSRGRASMTTAGRATAPTAPPPPSSPSVETAPAPAPAEPPSTPAPRETRWEESTVTPPRAPERVAQQRPAAPRPAMEMPETIPASSAPERAYPEATEFNGSEFEPESALQGMGEWVEIGNERFFVPQTTQLQEAEDWQPYQHGYWTYDKEQSWTWVSYEPWGWVTDHYGVWRHHKRYGWVWLPFHDRHYEAHCVTWFDEGDYVGWYPYFREYERGYRFRADLGFDDGYWDGYNAVMSIQISAPGFFFGFTLIPRVEIAAINIRRVIIRDRPLIFRIARIAHQHDRWVRIGRWPGGDRRRAYEYLQRWSTHRVPIGRAQYISARGGARILQPYRAYEIPEQYRRDRWFRRQDQRPDAGPRPLPVRRDDRWDHRRDRTTAPSVLPAPSAQPPQQPQAPRVIPRQQPPPAPAAQPAPAVQPRVQPQTQPPAVTQQPPARSRGEERGRPWGLNDRQLRPQVVPPSPSEQRAAPPETQIRRDVREERRDDRGDNRPGGGQRDNRRRGDETKK